MSIRTRLTLWYTGLLALSLLAFGILLYSLLVNILTTVLDDRLSVQADNVVNLIQAENDPVSVIRSGRAQLPPINIFASQYYIQIVNSQGEVVQLSENLQGQRLPLAAGSTLLLQQSLSYTATMGRSVHLRVFSTPIVLAQQPVGAIQVAQSLTDIEESLAVIRRTVVLGSFAALMLAAVGGVILARAALRPIGAISDTAQRITQAQDLSQRIPVSFPGDELGRLTGTINEMLERLESLFETQQRLVADVSHELRSPMTIIQGNLELLHRDASLDPEARAETLQAIENETLRMTRLVSDLLLLAQADAGLALHRQPVEMDTLLLEVYRQAQLTADGITVRLGAEDQVLVFGDPDRLRQLLLNLVDNAIKYTTYGGTVTLTMMREDGWMRLAVSDTGVGIAPQDLPHVFERFYRADRGRSRSGGSGLGLAIAHWIAQAHGGRLEAESDTGRGSTFTLWLPLADTGQPDVILTEETP